MSVGHHLYSTYHNISPASKLSPSMRPCSPNYITADEKARRGLMGENASRGRPGSSPGKHVNKSFRYANSNKKFTPNILFYWLKSYSKRLLPLFSYHSDKPPTRPPLDPRALKIVSAEMPVRTSGSLAPLAVAIPASGLKDDKIVIRASSAGSVSKASLAASVRTITII